MKRFLLAVIAGIFFSASSHAQTGVCNDGTTTNAQTKRGACSGHGGVNRYRNAQGSNVDVRGTHCRGVCGWSQHGGSLFQRTKHSELG